MLSHLLPAIMGYAGCNAWLPCALICRETMLLAHNGEKCVTSRAIVGRSPVMMTWSVTSGAAGLRDVSWGATQYDALRGRPFAMAWLRFESGRVALWDTTSLRMIFCSCNLALLEWMIELAPDILDTHADSHLDPYPADFIGDYIQGAHKLQRDIYAQTGDLLRLRDLGINPTHETLDKARYLGSEIERLILDMKLSMEVEARSAVMNVCMIASNIGMIRYST
jgi:hypothetical protein